MNEAESASCPRARTWLGWLLVLAGTAAVLLLLRDRLDKAHVALILLLVVLGGSAYGGRMLGLTLSGLAFLLFDLVFLPPYYQLRVADPFDWLVLIAFLVTGIVAAQLLERQRHEAEVARQRAVEIDRLATLGAETLNAPRPDDALHAIASVIAQAMHVDRCDIEIADGGDSNGARGDGTNSSTEPPLPAREMRRPLEVRGMRVGTLLLRSARPFLLSRDQERVLGALSYYAALGVERIRLGHAEEEADALRRADRVKDALIASVSHDLRTPLTTIKGIADEIGRGGDATRAWVIEEEADHLSALVDDLLDLSQLSAGQMKVAPALNTVDDAIGAALQRVESALEDRVVNVALGAEWPLLVGRFDLAHTTRILANLLENAARYTPASTPVRVRAWRDAPWLCIAVEDAGGGVSVEERERIFEPFVRGTGAERQTRGTGLGLSIARQLAEVQGGQLTYEPDERVHSRFVLRLPEAEPVPDAPHTEAAERA
jgi:two-component system sensor histidine kinase KdpD